MNLNYQDLIDIILLLPIILSVAFIIGVDVGIKLEKKKKEKEWVVS